MLETSKKFVEEVNELKDLCMGQIGNQEMLMNLDGDSLKLIQISMKLIDTSNELILKQAELMNKIKYMEMKLDKILEQTRKESR